MHAGVADAPESSDSDSGASWEYVQATPSPDSSGEPYYSQSQPFFAKGGRSYTPKGWKRKYRSPKKKTTATKKLKFMD